MLAIAINVMSATLRRRGSTRQLAGAIVTCVVSALLLLPAIIWYNLRFGTEQAVLAVAEVETALFYIALWGWFLPLSVTAAYCLFAPPHTTRQMSGQASPRANTPMIVPPRRSLDTIPFVFGKDTAWGWVEYRAGRFQGQRLALTRALVTLGREDDNDIWLDDDMASRYHAELSWREGTVYLTDCKSLNGISLNGQRVQGSAMVKQGDVLDIGSHSFLFEYAERSATLADQDDPLSHHAGRVSISQKPVSGTPIPQPQPLAGSESSEVVDVSTALTTPMSPLPPVRPMSSPMPLRLPSKPKSD